MVEEKTTNTYPRIATTEEADRAFWKAGVIRRRGCQVKIIDDVWAEISIAETGYRIAWVQLHEDDQS